MHGHMNVKKLYEYLPAVNWRVLRGQVKSYPFSYGQLSVVRWRVILCQAVIRAYVKSYRQSGEALSVDG